MRAVLRKWLSRVGPQELAIILPLLVVVAGTWCFIKLASEVIEGETMPFDEWAIRSLRRADDPALPIGPPELIGAARDVTALGSVSVLVLLLCAVCGYLTIERKYKAVAFVLFATLGGLLLSTLSKYLIQRDRPTIVPHLAAVSSPSFPSGHSALSALVYLTLGALLAKITARRAAKIFIIAVACLLAFLVGASRVYLGVHYPTDVLAGWTLGLVWAVVCLLVAQYLQRRGMVEPPS